MKACYHIARGNFINKLLMITIVISMNKSYAQSNVIDSIETELSKSKHDTISVFMILQLSALYANYDTVKAYTALNEGLRLVEKLKWNYAWGSYYQNRADIKQSLVYYDQTTLNFDSSIYFFSKAVKDNRFADEVARAKLSIATCKGQKADVLLKQGKSNEAISEYFNALEAWKSSDQPNKLDAIGTYYTKISTVYYDLNQFEKALEYDKKSLTYMLQGNDDERIAFSHIYICDDFYALKKTDSALAYLRKARPIIFKLNNHRLNIQYYSKLAQGKRLKLDFKGAIEEYLKLIKEAKFGNNKFQLLAAHKNIGSCYFNLGDLKSARHYYLLALPPAVEGNYFKEKLEILQQMVFVEERSGNKSSAYNYLTALSTIKDSLALVASNKTVAEIENKYQAAEKGKEIIRLQKDKELQVLSLNQKNQAIRQQSVLNYFMASFLFLFLLAGFFGFRNFRHRQLLARQKHVLNEQLISELEKDKQLVAVDSMLKGQEQERTRLARDLHDGLGGMLSGVKFSLMNMKTNLIINHENVVMFERSLDMLDSSIQELRRVAHNMMPETLVKFGLDEALKDYCNNINTSQIVVVRYQSFGMEERLESSVEIIIYRIVQELFANIFKHAKATEVIVQLLKEGNRLSITVEDNGKGFGVDSLELSKGAGWLNIRSRVDYLKGKLDLHSEAGKGTSVNIELHV